MENPNNAKRDARCHSTFDYSILARDVTVGNDDRVTGRNANFAIIGGSGSGKTTYVCSNLNNPDGSSIVVQDTKGRLCSQYKKTLINNGYNVYVVDFVNPEKSFGYNPLKYIHKRSDGTYREKDIKKLATLLMPRNLDRDTFWQKAAIRYICILIGYVCEALPESEHTMSSVIRLHRLFMKGDGDELLDKHKEEYPDSYVSRKYDMMNGSRSADKMWSSIYEFATEALDPFDCVEFYNIFDCPASINLHHIGERRTALFINTSDSSTAYGVLVNIFNSQLLQTLLEDADKNENGRLKMPVRIYLDDFAASAGQISDFDNTISVIRSRGISVSIMLQSISQLENMYSPERAVTILNNCDTTLFLGTNDISTAKYISSHVNITPHSVLSLPSDKAILLRSGEEPRYVYKLTPQDEITGIIKQ